jgi:hypothetical protein
MTAVRSLNNDHCGSPDLSGFMVSIPPVSATDFDRGAPVHATIIQPGFQTGFFTVFQHIQDEAQFGRGNHQIVPPVSLVRCDLVQTAHLYTRIAAFGERFFAPRSKRP